MSIRAAAVHDLPRIKQIAAAAQMFTAEEVEFFDEMFAGALDGSLEDHQWLVMTYDAMDTVVAGANYAPEPFSDRVWNLYFIAVDPAYQSHGVGRSLVSFIEEDLRAKGEETARVLLVDTSSTDQYARTRAFYAARGFVEEARTPRQFYGPGDDKVTFWKLLPAD